MSLLVSASAENLSLQSSVNLVNGHRFIQGKTGGMYVIYTCDSVLELIVKGTRSPLQSMLKQKSSSDLNLDDGL